MNPRHILVGLVALCAVAGLFGCSEGDADREPAIRPVLSELAALQPGDVESFTGKVEPRFSHELGFRVLGRVVARNVEVGQQVKAGEVLASLDSRALELAVRQLEAELAKARAQLDNAAATKDRKTALFKVNAASQAEVDTAEEALAAANASVVQGQARLDKANEQLSYTQLRSQTDGIVTAVSLEVGQIVTQGLTVVTVAQADVREAVVDVPDEIAQTIRPGDAFTARLQADLDLSASGRVREIAPQADEATRTRRVRITLDQPAPAFRIGTNVRVTPTHAYVSHVGLPRSALLTEDGRTFVWIVDAKALTVSRRPVDIAGDPAGGPVRVTRGVDVGDRVVTAGVHSLSEGQKVRIDAGMVL
ncbi:efflux RND transporter periplasmic adaptor subunit [Amorphus sp. MBR-141]